MKISRHFYIAFMIVALLLASVAASADTPVYIRKNAGAPPETPPAASKKPSYIVRDIKQSSPVTVYKSKTPVAMSAVTSQPAQPRKTLTQQSGYQPPVCTPEKLAALKELNRQGRAATDALQRDGKALERFLTQPGMLQRTYALNEACGPALLRETGKR